MADKKISALTAASTPLAGTEVLPIVQSGSTVKVSVANLTDGRSFNASGMTLTSTDAGATAAPLLDLYRDSASPAASDTLGEIEFNGEDSAGNKQTYGVIHGSILSPTSTAEQGQLHFETATAGALTEKMIIGTTNLVINEPGNIFNVRIEGDTDANLFYTDATNSRVGIGTSAPSAKLNVAGNTTISGNTDLGAQADSVTAAGYSTRVSGASVTNNGTDWYGSYGRAIWNANTSLTGGARRFAFVNGINYTNFGLIRSVDANTDPALGGNGGTVSSGTLDWSMDTSGNNTLHTGNLVLGTAAKGIDFSANTGAAGMTSELLNWYEEGTWTPAVTATIPGITPPTIASTSGTYTRIGQTVYITYNVLFGANGTGSGAIKVDALPYTLAQRGFGLGVESDVIGFAIYANAIAATTYALVTKIDGTYPGGTTYRLQGNFSYIV